jgi:hypothetical protein
MEPADEEMDWLLRFRHRNAQHEKQLVFRLGAQAGFFSEVNNLLLAVLYCLRSNIRFRLSSRCGTFGVQYGWADYFVPIFEERGNPFERRVNARARTDLTMVKMIGAALYKRITGID